jgi:hypothetical protein
MSDTTIEQMPGSEPVAAVPASGEQLVAMLLDRARSEVLHLSSCCRSDLEGWASNGSLVRVVTVDRGHEGRASWQLGVAMPTELQGLLAAVVHARAG